MGMLCCICAGVFPVVISRAFALALTIYTVATQLLLYYVRSPRCSLVACTTSCMHAGTVNASMCQGLSA
jgi:hypothetical protein